MAELEEFELETDLLEVGEPSKALDLGDPIDELPEVRKYPVIYRVDVAVMSHLNSDRSHIGN